uniref:ATP-dependent DNA helicase n=1 Tax=Onchocerca volvulus TaxID=6282 RepID=A0A8R1XKQ2_ONCVO
MSHQKTTKLPEESLWAPLKCYDVSCQECYKTYITFTSYPAWDDIQNLLLPGQSPMERVCFQTEAEIANGFPCSTVPQQRNKLFNNSNSIIPIDTSDSSAVIICKSIDTAVEADEAVNYPTEFLNSLDLSGMPPHVLQLKIGMSIIMLRKSTIKTSQSAFSLQ